jgi:tRNA G46 methylase TrmB
VPGGKLHVATDHAEYWEQIEAVLNAHPAFEQLPSFGHGVFPLPVVQPLTNYEAKYRIEGRRRFRASWQRGGAATWRPPAADRSDGRFRI